MNCGHHQDKRKIFLRWILPVALVFLLSACGRKAADSALPQTNGESLSIPAAQLTSKAIAPGEQTSSADPIATSMANKETEADSSTIWEQLHLLKENPYDAADAIIAFHDLVSPEAAPRLLMEGLSHPNPVVQWFSAYQLLDYLDQIDPNELRKPLTDLSHSEKTFVKEAGKLTLAVLQKNWDSSVFLKSPGRTKAAFTRFKDCQATDGDIFIVENNQVKSYELGFNTRAASWSPDGSHLACYSTNRYGKTLQVLEPKTGKIYSIDDNVLDSLSPVLSRLALKPSRGFSDLKLLQWSPDGKRLLLAYSYSNVDLIDSRVLLVNEYEKNSVDWAVPLVDEDLTDPYNGEAASEFPSFTDGFQWEAKGYGWPGGSIAALPSRDLLDQSGLAVQAFMESISDEDPAVFSSFSGKKNDEQIQAALEDFRVFSRGKPLSRCTFSGMAPDKANSFRYRIYNENQSSISITMTLNENGAFTCAHPFMEYSSVVHKLVKEYILALRQEDSKALIHLLSGSKLVSPERIRALIETYKVNLDIKKLNFVFTGQLAGDPHTGSFYYEARNEADNVLNGIHVNFGNGTLSLLDSWLEQIE